MPKTEKKKNWKETQRERQIKQQRAEQSNRRQRERDEKRNRGNSLFKNYSLEWHSLF